MTRSQLIVQGLDAHKSMVENKYGKGSLFSVTLYGSQNYLLDRETSDVDTHAMLIPARDSVILGHPMVTEEMQAVDKSICKVKDYRLMFKTLRKENINFLELLYTDHYWVNPDFADLFTQLRDNRDSIANARPLKLVHMTVGLCNQVALAMDRMSDDKKADIERYGYSPRLLSQLCRLVLFLESYLVDHSFGDALVPDHVDRRSLLMLKTDPVSYETACKLRERKKKRVDELMAYANKFLEEDIRGREVDEFLDDLAIQIFSRASLISLSSDF